MFISMRKFLVLAAEVWVANDDKVMKNMNGMRIKLNIKIK